MPMISKLSQPYGVKLDKIWDKMIPPVKLGEKPQRMTYLKLKAQKM